jgi:hypothetical protein
MFSGNYDVFVQLPPFVFFNLSIFAYNLDQSLLDCNINHTKDKFYIDIPLVIIIS